ncbi:MAG: VOC family protein [Chloroflexi bacterium]|nr:VOC family protein [Chloroflexota bacterium]
MSDSNPVPLFQNVDSVQFYVPDIEAGVRYYRDMLGHEIIWRTESAVGFRLPDSEAEIVIQNVRDYQEIDLKVDSADAAAQRIQDAGGEIIVPPFDIQIGRAVVVEDPWGNRMALLDSSKGSLITNADGNVIGVG